MISCNWAWACALRPGSVPPLLHSWLCRRLFWLKWLRGSFGSFCSGKAIGLLMSLGDPLLVRSACGKAIHLLMTLARASAQPALVWEFTAGDQLTDSRRLESAETTAAPYGAGEGEEKGDSLCGICPGEVNEDVEIEEGVICGDGHAYCLSRDCRPEFGLGANATCSDVYELVGIYFPQCCAGVSQLCSRLLD